ncbi:GART (predicted) [Pycnogonum litorale]
MGEKVLLIGSGGREHAICWSLSKSEDIKHIYVTPGNAGTSSKSGNKVSNVDVDIKNHDVVIKFCRENCINFVVVGPENPLADGIQDSLSSVGIPCFGPSKQAARIESSKVFAKKFMDRHNIPTADWHSFTTCNEAYSYIDQ